MGRTLDSDLAAKLDGFLIELNHVSAQAILPLFRGDHGLEDKGATKDGRFDPVTKADRGAEAAIRALIGDRFADHGVIGEEYGEDRPDAEFVWVVDPIDGTRAFVAGLPVWTTLIGLRFQGAPVIGSIGQPHIGEVFIGGPAGARMISRHDERPLKVRACERLTDATIATTDPAIFDGAERGAWRQVRATARLARLGCDAYAYAMVAAGLIDLVVETNLKAWDIEAAMPVIAGAGGLVTDWLGRSVTAEAGQIAIAGDRRCLDEALVALKRSAK